MIDYGTTTSNLRLGLDRAAASHQLSPDSWTQIEQRVVSRRRPRMAIAAVAAAVAVATVIAVTLYLRPPLPAAAPRNSGSASSQQLVIAGRLHIARAVSRVAAGAGAVWVGGLNVTYRVNPATNKVVATIPTPGTDEFSQLAVGAGSVWVSGGNGPGYQLGVYRINPQTSKVTAFIDLQKTGLLGPIAIAYGSVWVTGGNLYRVNPRTNRIVGPHFEFGAEIASVVPAAGALWVTSTNGRGEVSRIDPRSGASGSLNLAAWSKITNIDASGAGSLWMTGKNVVDRVDPVSGRITAAMSLPGVDRVYFWRNSAWAVTSSSGGTASIVRVDPATNKVTGKGVTLGSGPEAVAAGPTGIWAVNIGDQQLLHLVLRTIRKVDPRR
jgi:streptogramin lyase